MKVPKSFIESQKRELKEKKILQDLNKKVRPTDRVFYAPEYDWVVEGKLVQTETIISQDGCRIEEMFSLKDQQSYISCYIFLIDGEVDGNSTFVLIGDL